MSDDAESWVRRIHARQDAQTKRFGVKQAAVDYKGGSCELCGYSKSLRSLHFHHADPNEKDFNVSDRMSASWDVIKSELDKCYLVCANCHSEIHDGLHPRILRLEEEPEMWVPQGVPISD